MSAPVLQARGVNVRFGGVHAVKDVDLDVDAGQIVGLIGPNGAGKSTTFNVITGLQPASGRILFEGSDISRLSPHKRARLGIGRTFQRLEVFSSLSILDNVLVAAEAKYPWARERANQLAYQCIERVGLAGQSGYRVGALSTGTARLVELARALASEPKVLLLDEPASGLDDAESERLGDLLIDLAGDGVAILVVEHDIELVMKICAHIYVLNFGEILASAPPEAIRSDQRVLDAYLGAPL